jgi:plastocyanin
VTFLGGGELVALVVPVPDAEPGTLMFNPMAGFPTRMPDGPVETITGTTFANSGVMAVEPEIPDTPPNDTFTATFNEPGLYEYVCLFHPWMKGAILVLPDAAAEVPEQPEVDQHAQAEMDELLGMIELARAQSEMAFSEPGPDGTTIWYVKAGAVNGITADLRAQSYDFLPKELTIQEGDTVVWTSAEIHTITFVPLPPTPEALVIEPQENGPPLLLLNPEVFFPIKPAGVYDPLQYFNSGPIGPVGFAGLSFSLTFRDAGSFEYVCALHEGLGMKGVITVVPR